MHWSMQIYCIGKKSRIFFLLKEDLQRGNKFVSINSLWDSHLRLEHSLIPIRVSSNHNNQSRKQTFFEAKYNSCFVLDELLFSPYSCRSVMEMQLIWCLFPKKKYICIMNFQKTINYWMVYNMSSKLQKII